MDNIGLELYLAHQLATSGVLSDLAGVVERDEDVADRVYGKPVRRIGQRPFCNL